MYWITTNFVIAVLKVKLKRKKVKKREKNYVQV